MSVQEMAIRNRKHAILECSDKNRNGQIIIDVDCEYDNGKFVLTYLPCPLPSLFTVRFTAPADYTQGDVIVVKGREMPVRTPGMVNAFTGLYKAGAVMHCDIDMDREVAFAWQGAGTATGLHPNLSFDEQFAGFYDWDGDKVYVKSVNLGILEHPTTQSKIDFPHNIPNIKTCVDMRIRLASMGMNAIYTDCFCAFDSLTWITCNFHDYFVRTHFKHLGSSFQLRVILYYTCTDR